MELKVSSNVTLFNHQKIRDEEEEMFNNLSQTNYINFTNCNYFKTKLNLLVKIK